MSNTHKLYSHDCENCGKSFEDEETYYDLCPECVGPYEEALAEAQSEDPSVLVVAFPKS